MVKETVYTSLPNDRIFRAKLRPGERLDVWICSQCQQDKTYTFSYQLRKPVSWEKSWWCEDCVRKAGLIW
jgi:hypothetical protein